MSENQQDSHEDTAAGISDDQLPEDLVPSDDNPLAEGLPAGERADDELLTSGKHPEDEEGNQPDADEDTSDSDEGAGGYEGDDSSATDPSDDE